VLDHFEFGYPAAHLAYLFFSGTLFGNPLIKRLRPKWVWITMENPLCGRDTGAMFAGYPDRAT
jgi:hypothetical protein